MNTAIPLQPVAPTRIRTLRAGGRRRTKTMRAHHSYSIDELTPLYTGLSGFNANTAELSGQFQTTYGEVTPVGMESLTSHFKGVAGVHAFPKSQRTFYDLGCGAGRVVHGIALLNPELSLCHGIEIVPDRISYAQIAKSRLKHRDVFQRVKFDLLSILDDKLDYGDACWIFISNLCFSDEIQKELGKKLERELNPKAVVICSKQFHFSPESGVRLVNPSAPVAMSWASNSSVHIYQKQR